MSWNQALRWLGLLGLIGGVLLIVSFVLSIFNESNSLALILNLIAMIFILLVSISIYYVQVNKLGAIGFLLFLVAFIGTSLLVSISWQDVFIFPVLEEHAPQLAEGEPPSPASEGFFYSFLLFSLGWTLFGLWSIIKKGLPLLPIALIVLGSIANWLPMGYFVAIPLCGLGVIWLGYLIWSNKIQAA